MFLKKLVWYIPIHNILFCLRYTCRDQQTSSELDIVTGFQVLDGTMHLFVLEGLKTKSIKHIWESLPKPEKNSKTTKMSKFARNSYNCYKKKSVTNQEFN